MRVMGGDWRRREVDRWNFSMRSAAHEGHEASGQESMTRGPELGVAAEQRLQSWMDLVLGFWLVTICKG